ncbi:MAG: peptide-methionine (S)-S-oxide reductase MsrA [Microgenomates group bacterium]
MIEIATLANGCFWCTEAIFQQLRGVISVTPGYSGGERKNPTYEQVSTGVSGHAEAIQIEFDPDQILYETILDIFWHTHNPTTLNRQGADVGTQYRSAIFYHSKEQKKIANTVLKKIENEDIYTDPIVTEITQLESFFPAEEYHQNYYKNNSDALYCTHVIEPKLQKFWEKYKHLIN